MKMLLMSLMMLVLLFFLSESLICLALCVVVASIFCGSVLGKLLSSWFLVAVILVFTGGMMIIFLYITSLASNEKLISSFPSFYSLLAILFVGLSLVTPLNSNFTTLQCVSFFYSSMTLNLILFLMCYLLLCLLIVVKLCESFKGSMTIM